jgi:hypothetical protein
MASTEPKNSRCAGPALLMSATSGAASRARYHRVAMAGSEFQQGERHADIVVEVAARREYRGLRIED